MDGVQVGIFDDWPVRWDIHVRDNADFGRRFTWRDGDSRPKDLTDATAMLQVRQSPGDAEPLLALDETDGLTLGGTAGTIDVAIAADTAADFDWSRAIYDLRITLADGSVTTLLEGGVFVDRGISR